MIENTFSMLEGIGEKSERRLWRRGILTWADFLGRPAPGFIGPGRKALYDRRLGAASERLGVGDSAYFRQALPSREHWRLFPRFRDRAVCLDIETTGLGPGDGGYPTVVGLYDGSAYRCFVRGRDLTAERLMRHMEGCQYLITFYGTVFDLPFLERSLPGFRVDVPHFDLCFGARRLGFRGGLKSLERQLGIERPEAARGLDGSDAVLLWEQARGGSRQALDLLVLYNREDTVNLLRLADILYGGLRTSTGIEEFLS